MTAMKSLLINLTLFQVGWFACVFSAAAGVPLIGVAAVAVAVIVHLVLSENPRSEGILMFLAIALGVSWESALVAAGVVSYEVGNLLPGMAPYWIVAMWVLFATTLNSSMRWLRKSLPLAIATGAIGGPMSYFAGLKFGAINFSDTGVALALIGVGWAVLLPLMVRAGVWLEETELRLIPLRAQTQGEES